MTQLARDIDIFDQTTLPDEDEVPDRRATIRHIKSLVRRELHGDAKVQVFGSSRVGTDLPTSDVDIAVNHDIIWKRWLDQGGDRNASQDVINEVIKPDMITRRARSRRPYAGIKVWQHRRNHQVSSPTGANVVRD